MPNVTQTELEAAYLTARSLARSQPTPENRDAAVAASAELATWIAKHNPPKRGTFSCRAGQRQWAELRARQNRR